MVFRFDLTPRDYYAASLFRHRLTTYPWARAKLSDRAMPPAQLARVTRSAIRATMCTSVPTALDLAPNLSRNCRTSSQQRVPSRETPDLRRVTLAWCQCKATQSVRRARCKHKPVHSSNSGVGSLTWQHTCPALRSFSPFLLGPRSQSGTAARTPNQASHRRCLRRRMAHEMTLRARRVCHALVQAHRRAPNWAQLGRHGKCKEPSQMAIWLGAG